MGLGNFSFENRLLVPWVLAENFSRYAAEESLQAPMPGLLRGHLPVPPGAPLQRHKWLLLSSQLRIERVNIPLHTPRPPNPWATRGPRLNALHLLFKKRKAITYSCKPN